MASGPSGGGGGGVVATTHATASNSTDTHARTKLEETSAHRTATPTTTNTSTTTTTTTTTNTTADAKASQQLAVCGGGGGGGGSSHLDTTPLTTIHNLVGTCEIASSIMPIDLEYVYRCLPNSFYDRKRFAAITIRVTEPVCTGLLFTSGKLVITGCKTLIECVLASLKIVRMLQRHISSVSFLVRNAVVQNVVAHVVLPLLPGQRLNVDRLYEVHACNCTFQKHMFPVRYLAPVCVCACPCLCCVCLCVPPSLITGW